MAPNSSQGATTDGRSRDRRRSGLLVVISSPSGGGKSTVCRRLLRRDPEMMYSVSATTRKRRRGERNGIHYQFVTTKRFKEMIARNQLAEYAQVHGYLYGTPKVNIRDALRLRRVLLFDLDIVGGLAIKRRYPDAVLIFLEPPSREALRERLIERATEDASAVRKRLTRARKELPFWRLYDYVVVNDELTDTVSDCAAIIRAERLRSERAQGYKTKLSRSLDTLED